MILRKFRFLLFRLDMIFLARFTSLYCSLINFMLNVCWPYVKVFEFSWFRRKMTFFSDQSRIYCLCFQRNYMLSKRLHAYYIFCGSFYNYSHRLLETRNINFSLDMKWYMLASKTSKGRSFSFLLFWNYFCVCQSSHNKLNIEI